MADRYGVLFADGTLWVVPPTQDQEAKAFKECDDSNFDPSTPVADRNVVVRIAEIKELERPLRPDGKCPACGRDAPHGDVASAR